MNKIAQRLLTFFIGIPACAAIVWFPVLKHLPLEITCLAISILGANEFYRMLAPKTKLFPRWVILAMDAIVYIAQYVFMTLGYNPELNIWIYAVGVLVLMGSSVFTDQLEGSISKIALSAFIPLYCGFLFSFFPALSFFEKQSTFLMLLFLTIVFMCDSCAWFFGVLFGKGNRGVFPASPNKSVAGLIGGIFGAILFACLVNFLFRNVVDFAYWKISIIAFLTSLCAIIGDLIESVFKRDCGVKDSGKIVPGRGGIMDCMDSVTAAAPIFFILIYFFLMA